MKNAKRFLVALTLLFLPATSWAITTGDQVCYGNTCIEWEGPTEYRYLNGKREGEVARLTPSGNLIERPGVKFIPHNGQVPEEEKLHVGKKWTHRYLKVSDRGTEKRTRICEVTSSRVVENSGPLAGETLFTIECDNWREVATSPRKETTVVMSDGRIVSYSGRWDTGSFEYSLTHFVRGG